MTKQQVYTTQVPAGCEMYDSSRPGQGVAAFVPSYLQPGVELAPPSGVEYIPPVPTCTHWYEIKAKTCLAPKAKGTDFCIGHLNQQAKLAKSKE